MITSSSTIRHSVLPSWTSRQAPAMMSAAHRSGSVDGLTCEIRNPPGDITRRARSWLSVLRSARLRLIVRFSKATWTMPSCSSTQRSRSMHNARARSCFWESIEVATTTVCRLGMAAKASTAFLLDAGVSSRQWNRPARGATDRSTSRASSSCVASKMAADSTYTPSGPGRIRIDSSQKAIRDIIVSTITPQTAIRHAGCTISRQSPRIGLPGDGGDPETLSQAGAQQHDHVRFGGSGERISGWRGRCQS